MADQWSDHFASSQPGLTRVGQRRVSAGIGHSRLRYKRAAITLDLAPSAFTAADVARIMQFHSNDRLIELFVYSAGDAGTVAVDIGLSASTYSADDNAMWDLCLTATATLDTADEAMVIEAFYTSGD